MRRPALLLLLIVPIGAMLYFWLRPPTPTIVYVGRKLPATEAAWGRFDGICERSLRVVVDNLSGNAINGEIHYDTTYLDDFGHVDSDASAIACYEDLLARPEVIAIVDGTWGRNFQPAAERIAKGRVPVLSLNADRPKLDTNGRAVFFGHDEGAEVALNAVLGDIIEEQGDVPVRVFFIGEENWKASQAHEESLKAEVRSLNEARDASDLIELELTRLPEIRRTDAGEPEMDYPDHFRISKRLYDVWDTTKSTDTRVVFVVATHGAWGRELISFIGSTFSDTTVLTVAAAVSTMAHKERVVERGNQLIVQTYPAELVSLDVHRLWRATEGLKRDEVNAPRYLRIVKDAEVLLAWALRRGNPDTKDVVRLRERILNGLLELDTDEVVEVESSFGTLKFKDAELLRESQLEITDSEGSRPFRLQVNHEGVSKPVSRLGLRLTGVSQVDPSSGTFSAEFFLRCDGGGEDFSPVDILQAIVFPGVVEDPYREVLFESEGEGENRAILKVVGEFSADFNLRRFPVDAHDLQIEIVPPVQQESFVHLDRSKFRVGDGDTVARGWIIDEVFETADPPSVESGKGATALNIHCRVRRVRSGPFVALVLPLMILGASVLLSCTLVSDMQQRIDYSRMVFLAVIAFGITFYTVRPVTNRLTLIDTVYFAVLALSLAPIVRAEAATASGRMIWRGVAFCALFTVAAVLLFRFY